LIICRPGVIFGEGERGNFTRLARALERGYFFIPGNPGVIKSCGYVKDLIDSMLFIITKQFEPIIVYNFCYPTPVSIGEICYSFHRVAGYKVPHTIPLRSFIKILKRMPVPIKTISSRIEKLQTSTYIEPVTLKNLNFMWNTELDGALRDWVKKDNAKYLFE
jgi:nucleoside-diphosphate-sugar epimerase